MKKYTGFILILFLAFFIYHTERVDGAETKKIVGFEELNEEDKLVYPGEKATEEEINNYLPEYINVYIEGEEESRKLPVKWKSAAVDYESTDYYCYQFSPVWDEDEYILDDRLNLYSDAPYIFVCFGERLKYSGILSRASGGNEKNADKILKYLTDTMGLSTAAACGVVANIYYESGCVADIIENGYTWDNGGGYGICQWTNYPRTAAYGRRTSLVSFCERRGYDYKSLNGQLKYLQYELTTGYYSVLNSLKDINVTSKPQQDAYNAAYIWCTKFEIPADAENAAVIRGNFAKTLWKDYSSGSVKTAAPKFTSYSYPDNITLGKGYPVTGNIESSPTNLTKVKVSIVNSAGKTVCSKTAAPGAKSYNVAKLDAYITFDKLSKGLYYYRITAVNSKGTYVLLDKDFVVSEESPKSISKVSGLTRSAKSATSVTISWNKITGVTGYVITRSEAPDGTYKKVAYIKGDSNVQYKDTKIPKGKQYYYRVRGYLKADGKTIYGALSARLAARTSVYSPAVYKKVKTDTRLYSEAGTSFSKVRAVKKGAKVRILNYAKDKGNKKWYYVKYGSKYGYIRYDKV